MRGKDEGGGRERGERRGERREERGERREERGERGEENFKRNKLGVQVPRRMRRERENSRFPENPYAQVCCSLNNLEKRGKGKG